MRLSAQTARGRVALEWQKDVTNDARALWVGHGAARPVTAAVVRATGHYRPAMHLAAYSWTNGKRGAESDRWGDHMRKMRQCRIAVDLKCHCIFSVDPRANAAVTRLGRLHQLLIQKVKQIVLAAGDIDQF